MSCAMRVWVAGVRVGRTAFSGTRHLGRLRRIGQLIRPCLAEVLESRGLISGTGYDMPVNLAVDSTTTSAARVKWTDFTTDEWRFRIQRSSGADFGTLLQNSTVPASTTSADVALIQGSATYVRVRAENGGVVSPWSVVQVEGTHPATSDQGPFAAPSGFAANTVSAGSVTLGWTDNSSAEWRFRIQRSTSVNFDRNLLNLTVPANTVTWTDTSVAPATKYYYRIRTEQGSNVSAWVATSATTSAATPAAPTGLVVADEPYTAGVLDVSWTDNASNETGYLLQRSLTADFFSGVSSIDLAPNTTSYRDTGLDRWTVYYYRVAAKGSAGNSSYSVADSNRTADDGVRPPVVVDNISAADSGGWTSSTAGSGYQGADFLSDGNQNKGGLTYRVYPPEGRYPGLYYKVEVWYPAVTGAASNVKVAIDSDDPAVHLYQGRDEFTLDQRTNTGTWVTLGTKLNPYVEFTNDGTDGVVSVDAVRFTPVDMQNTIVDVDASQLSSSGWTPVSDPRAIGGSYFAAPAFDPSVDDYSKYASTAPIGINGHYGDYELYIRYHAAPGNASNAPLHAESNVLTPNSDVALDQRTAGDRWVYVGRYSNGFWNSPYVTLSNLGADGPVTIDALLFRPISFTT